MNKVPWLSLDMDGGQRVLPAQRLAGSGLATYLVCSRVHRRGLRSA